MFGCGHRFHAACILLERQRLAIVTNVNNEHVKITLTREDDMLLLTEHAIVTGLRRVFQRVAQCPATQA